MYWDLWYWYGEDTSSSNESNVSNILLMIILAVICTLSIIITVISPKGVDGASQIFGYELRIVETNSMEACEATDVSEYEIGSLKKNTMIIITLVPEREDEAMDWYSNIKVGDVLTVRYTYDRQVTITHRVTAINLKPDNSGYIIELQGDNVNSDASQLTQVIDTSLTESRNYVIGKVIKKSYPIGTVISAFQRVTKALVSE